MINDSCSAPGPHQLESISSHMHCWKCGAICICERILASENKVREEEKKKGIEFAVKVGALIYLDALQDARYAVLNTIDKMIGHAHERH